MRCNFAKKKNPFFLLAELIKKHFRYVTHKMSNENPSLNDKICLYHTKSNVWFSEIIKNYIVNITNTTQQTFKGRLDQAWGTHLSMFWSTIFVVNTIIKETLNFELV